MPTLDDAFWHALYLRTGIPSSDKIKEFFRRMGVPQRWRAAGEPAQQDGVLASAATILRALHASGLGAGETLPALSWAASSGRRDERWALWRELRARARPAAAEWTPITFTRVVDVTAQPAVFDERVEVSFDHRMSQGAVVSAVRKIWPRLARSRWVEPTRPLASRNIALIRFVCLETEADTSWRSILQGWNQRMPKWRYEGPRQIERAFRRAEKELSGNSYGLEWFYSTEARPEGWASPTVREVAEMFGPDAFPEDRRFAARLAFGLTRQTEHVGRQMARVVTWAQDLAGKGVSEDEIARQLPGVWTAIDWTDGDEAHMIGAVRDLLNWDLRELPDPSFGGFRVEGGVKINDALEKTVRTRPPERPRRPVRRRTSSKADDH